MPLAKQCAVLSYIYPRKIKGDRYTFSRKKCLLDGYLERDPKAVLPGDRVPLALKHLVLEVQSFANKTFPENVNISVDIASDLWSIEGDATQLHQVLMNLFVNARDAMPNGGQLSVSATNLTIDRAFVRKHIEADAGSYVLLSVTDTGIGISPENLERIFEPFFSTKQSNGGTGLGLSTTYGIMRRHGGFITVDSEVGNGTQFKLYFPAIESSAIAAAIDP